MKLRQGKGMGGELRKLLLMLLGAGAAAAVCALAGDGLTGDGRLCLGFTVAAVAFWIFGVAEPSFVAGLYLIMLVVFRVGSPAEVFGAWTDGVVWLVIGSFIIAEAVVRSGICERLSYVFILKFVDSFRSLIISVFVLSTFLTLLIPNPWPRAFILVEVVKEAAEAARLSRRDAVAAGYSVFAASIPTCFIFQTGAASMNSLVLGFSGISLSWLEWFKVMGLPGIVLTAVYCLVILLVFRSKEPFELDREAIAERLRAMGPISLREKKTAIWLSAAILIWLTDGIHGINVAWTTMGIAMLMSVPVIGGLTDKDSWKAVPVDTVVYLTAAVAIGKVGSASGMTGWITSNILPPSSSLPGNIWLLAAEVALFSMLLHVCLGSTIAANSVIIPAMLLCTAGTGLTALSCTMICYTAIFGQYVFSYQHINILMGIGCGMYDERDSLKMALPLTAAVLLVLLLVDLPWWSALGILGG